MDVSPKEGVPDEEVWVWSPRTLALRWPPHLAPLPYMRRIPKPTHIDFVPLPDLERDARSKRRDARDMVRAAADGLTAAAVAAACVTGIADIAGAKRCQRARPLGPPDCHPQCRLTLNPNPL